MKNTCTFMVPVVVFMGIAMLLAFGSEIAIAENPETGNGAPSGAHYNLNIIGVPKDKTADMTGDSGHRIFVKLDGNSRILLIESEDGSFQVLDANATKGSAKFQLPNPDPDGNGTTVYSVYARALGKPGGQSFTAPCATDAGDDGIFGTEDDTTVCSVDTLELVRSKGRSKFVDVSDKLLYIHVDLDGDGVEEDYSLFDEALQDYLWNYDNNGLKLVQLRFYEIIEDSAAKPVAGASTWGQVKSVLKECPCGE